MNGRRLIVLLTLLVFGALLLATFFVAGQGATLPGQATALLDAYRAAQTEPLEIVSVARGSHPESLDQQLARPLPVSIRAVTRPSQGLYDSEVLRPVAAEAPIHPPQAIWCVTLQHEDGRQEQLLLSRYDQVAQAEWHLFRLLLPNAPQQLGCSENGTSS